MSWEPEYYVRGNYFQRAVSEDFLSGVTVKPYGDILDIGCGDGYYSNVVATQFKDSRWLAIDSSSEMIAYAAHHWQRENLSFKTHAIETSEPPMQFDFVLSFWCLHWTDIHVSFSNIFHALKENGRCYAVFSSFSDNSILQTWEAMSAERRYAHLKERCIRSRNSGFFYQVLKVLWGLPFKKINICLKSTIIPLPHIDYFRYLLLSLPFIKDMIPTEPDIIGDMLKAFVTLCGRKYNGQLCYEARPILLEAIK